MEINNPTISMSILTGLLGLFFLIIGLGINKFAKRSNRE